MLDPDGFDDRNESVITGAVVGEIVGGRDDMCDALEVKSFFGIVVDDCFAIVEPQLIRQLQLSVIIA